MKILGFKIFEKKRPTLITYSTNYHMDMIAASYFEKYYLAKHRRTFERIQKDVEKKFKELRTDSKAVITVRPYIEIRTIEKNK